MKYKQILGKVMLVLLFLAIAAVFGFAIGDWIITLVVFVGAALIVGWIHLAMHLIYSQRREEAENGE